MDDLEANANSVNYLITELCRSIAYNRGVKDDPSIAKLKSKSFEILLKKSKRPHFYEIPDDNGDFDPLRALDIQIFSAKLNTSISRQNRQKFIDFEDELNTIRDEPYFQNEYGRGVLQLLLLLQRNNCAEEKSSESLPHLLVPGAFTLHANSKNNKYYPESCAIDAMQSEPHYFKSIKSIINDPNPYLPIALKDGVRNNKLANIEEKYAIDMRSIASSSNLSIQSSCTFTGMAHNLLSTSLRIDVEKLKLNDIKLPKLTMGQYRSIENPVNTNEQTNKQIQQKQTDEQRIFSWNWEYLGCFGIPRSKPFVSDTDVALNLFAVHNAMLGQHFEAKVLTTQQFLHDIKYLVVGVQSDTFEHDLSFHFRMENNITVENMLPDTIATYVREFLVCGTCYKLMQSLIAKKDHSWKYDGFIFKAVCSAVNEYLLTFHQYVFALNDQCLLEFYQRMKKIIWQINTFARTLHVHPRDMNLKEPLFGSQLLSILYKQIMGNSDNDSITLWIYLLKHCCHVYFKHLQKWIYYGLLDDPSSELFIGFLDRYRENTKYFYDKAYFIVKDAVPGFFRTVADNILLCGKYTMLLKAYKPNHPIFDLKCPEMTVCLSLEDIQKLEAKCKKYAEKAQEICGKPLTIREIFEKRKEQRRTFLQKVAQRSKEIFKKWEEEQQLLANQLAAQKQQRLNELVGFLIETKQRKLYDRRTAVAHELNILQDIQRQTDNHLLRDNTNLRKRIDYYQCLYDSMELEEREERKKLKKALRKQTFDGDASSICTDSAVSTWTDSCTSSCGVDDIISEYDECLSNVILHKIAENQRELSVIYSDGSQISDRHETSDIAELNSQMDAKDLITIMEVNLKRSASDVFNSNILPDINQKTWQQNRDRILSGTNVEFCLRDFDSCNNRFSIDYDRPSIASPKLTEAQRNKLKVLSCEFDLFRETSPIPDINLNTIPDTELTELQRNRRRMMEDDLFSEYEKDPLESRKCLYLNLETERSRNRRRVLESEYNILTGTISTTTLTVDVMTPMSTTSDITITECSHPEQINDKKIDIENGNLYTANNSMKNLKINIDVALEQQQLDENLLHTATTIPEPTPECALNTAGLIDKDGFHFENVNANKEDNDDLIYNSTSENDLDDILPQIDYSTPYKRCEELISSKFKCAPLCPYFRLQTEQNTKCTDNKDSDCKQPVKPLLMNSMTVLSLTEFLQKSVTIPLATHFELMNNEVMRLFLEDVHIFDHLRSLRHYFFLMDGEFGSIICDGLISKLEGGASPQKLLNFQMLHAILDKALASSLTGHNKNADNLSFYVSETPESFDLSCPDVLNILSLSYRVEWPLNLILNPETLQRYTSIFRYLIKVRRISWVLEQAYQMLKEAAINSRKNILKSPQYCHVQQMRHKFYHFVHALQNHITASAFQASWKMFKDKLLEATSLEDIYRKHTTYIKRVRFLCMLNRQSTEFHKTIELIFKITLRFYNNLKSREFKLKSGAQFYTHSRYDKLANDELEFDKLMKYTIYLGNKIVRRGYQEEIGEFISLINFNNYYLKDKP